MAPEIRYAKSNGVHIAYTVLGRGPLDLVCVPGWVSHLECDPTVATPEHGEEFFVAVTNQVAAFLVDFSRWTVRGLARNRQAHPGYRLRRVGSR